MSPRLLNRRGLLLAGPCAALAGAARAETGIAAAADAYLQPYVASGNFSGVVRIERSGRRLFEKAYGDADRQAHRPNSVDTPFHVASVSMQLTAAAVLRLVDQGRLRLDEPIGDLAGAPARVVTVRNLLMERSGLPDINDRPDYGEILQRSQTPRSLVDAVAGGALLFPPGEKRLHEEHSAYNVLALLIEQSTGRSFRAAMQRLVFDPLGMRRSFADDDTASPPGLALPYEPQGLFGVRPARPIHWSAKAGNASACVTAPDHARWMHALFEGDFLSPASRAVMLDAALRAGVGWFRSDSKRFGGPVYQMNGRSPGFASLVFWKPDERLGVIAFSNIYSSATTTIGYDLADLCLGRAPPPFRPATAAPWQAALVGTRFRFGPAFYRPNVTLEVVRIDGGVALDWGGGQQSALIPTGHDRFTDRSYWLDVAVRRDAAGAPTALDYDGQIGARV